MNGKTRRNSENDVFENAHTPPSVFIRWVAFFTKTPKIVRFSDSNEIFDSNLFYWTRNTLHFMIVYDFSSFFVIAAHYCSFLVIFGLSVASEKSRKIPENEQ